MSVAIEVSGLCKSFAGNTVLNNINIQVPENAVYGFLGNNGAGKSTLIRTLLGLLKADQGEIHIQQKPVKYGDVAYRKGIGCLIDSACLYLQLTAAEFLKITCKLKGLPLKDRDRVLELVNMQQHRSIPMSKFSLGMKQRVAIANALLGDPKLLILDEPTNGLDPMGMQEIRGLLRKLPERIGATVFLSSHLLDEIQKTATHVGILHQGEMKLQSPLDALLANESSCMSVTSSQIQGIRDHFTKQLVATEILSETQLQIKDVQRSQCPEINKQIIDAGFELIESRFNQPSLEKLFLDLVKPKDVQNKGEKHAA